MISRLAHLQNLEQRMTYVRWFALVFAILSVTIEPQHPEGAAQTAIWVLTGALAAGSFAIWGASARTRTEDEHASLSAGAFAFDALLIFGFVWIYAFERPYVTWALLFILPLEGALRYRFRGALLATAAVALFFVPQSIQRADLMGDPFDLSTYVFVVSLAALVAGVTGTMAEQWHDKSVRFEAQSLKLAEVDRLKDRFLAITSHEIRGPLTAIIAGVDTVRKRRTRLSVEQSEQLLDMVSRQADHLARLVDDLQITSQLQSGQLRLQAGEADLEEVVEHALEAAASKRNQHHLEVFVEPLTCSIDGPRVGQILRNLVENAYKYTPDGTLVSVAARSAPDGIVLEVSDEGDGIPAAKRSELFKAFSRISETAAGQEGVGLGLFVVSQLVSAMRGRIDLSSSSRGSEFCIHLPCETHPVNVTAHLNLVDEEGETGS